MRSVRVVLAGLVALLAVLVVAPSPAFACSCVGVPTRELVHMADVVVLGTVQSTDEPDGLWHPFSGDSVTYVVGVDRVLEGEAPDRIAVSSSASGASCGLEGIHAGRRYVLFADRDDTGALEANLCGGTAPATPTFVAEVQATTGPGAPPTTETPAMTLMAAEARSAESPRWAAPAALAAAAGLALMVGWLWLRYLRG